DAAQPANGSLVRLYRHRLKTTAKYPLPESYCVASGFQYRLYSAPWRSGYLCGAVPAGPFVPVPASVARAEDRAELVWHGWLVFASRYSHTAPAHQSARVILRNAEC